MFHSSVLNAVLFFGMAFSVACAVADEPAEDLGDVSRVVCDVPGPREINQDVDHLIRLKGENGLACELAGTQKQCLSYTDVRPSPIALGDDHAAQTAVYLCAAEDGCSQQPQGYGCEFGGDCECGNFYDCAMMILDGNCEPDTFNCDGPCNCENTDGC